MEAEIGSAMRDYLLSVNFAIFFVTTEGRPNLLWSATKHLIYCETWASVYQMIIELASGVIQVATCMYVFMLNFMYAIVNVIWQSTYIYVTHVLFMCLSE